MHREDVFADLSSVFKNKSCLVTGGAGFLGSHLTEALIEMDARVVVIDSFVTGSRENLEDLNQQNLIILEGDVNKKEDIDKLNAYKFEYIFHLAATVGVKRTLENPLYVLQDIEGIKNILELSRNNPVEKVLYASSSEVYGEATDYPESEDHTPLNSRLPYAVVKSLGEVYFKTYYEQFGLPTTSLRFFNVYGPRQRGSSYGFVIGAFINRVIQDLPPQVYGDGNQTRDFTYVEDTITGILRAATTKNSDGESINLGTGTETSILELANQVIEISGNKDLQPSFLPPRIAGDMQRRCADTNKSEKLIGFKHQYTLNEGLQKTFDYYLNTTHQK